MISPESYKWRTGRKLGRTIYAMHDKYAPSDNDVLLGMMDSPYIAEMIVREHNEKRKYKSA